MAPSYTTDTFVARIKRKAQLPDYDAKLTDAEVLQIADEEVQTRLFAALLTVREDYFVDYRYVTLEAGQRWAQLPTFVASSTILDCGWVDPTDANGRIQKLQRSFSGMAHYSAAQSSSQPYGYVTEGDRIGLVVPCQSACTLLLRYERRPSRMHLSTDGRSAPISSYDPTNGNFTLTDVTADVLANMPVGSFVDLARATPPLGVPVQGLVVDAVANPIWTLSPGTIDHSAPTDAPIVYSQINAGDYVTMSGETPVFPLPDVWWTAAITAAAATVCREIGDLDQATLNDGLADRLIAAAVGLQSNRARNDAHTFVNRDSPLRAGPWTRRTISQDQWFT
jgi:hypothetical protein